MCTLPCVGTPASGRRFWHWTVIVPILSLVGWGVGYLVHHLTGRVEQPLELTPPPQTQIPPIVFPPRSHALIGTVLGPDGALIDDALVSTIAADEPHWTYTNARGEFRLEGLERGPWTITVAATAHQPFTATFADEVTPVVVQLPDAAREMPRLAPRTTAPLTGQVRADPGTSLEGFEVYFTPTLPPEEIDAPFPRRALCDRAGHFEIADLQTGEYTVAVLPEWAQNGTWPDLGPGTKTKPNSYSHRVGVATTYSIELVSGSVHGVVTDREDNALEGALVLVSSEVAPERIWPPVRAGAKGEFVVPDLPPGRYVVAVRAGSGSCQSTVTVGDKQTVELSLPPLAVERPR